MSLSLDTGAIILTFAACGLVAALPLWLLVRGVKRGVWNGRGVNVYRSERPSAFWFGIVMYAVGAAIIMSFPLYVAWDAFADR